MFLNKIRKIFCGPGHKICVRNKCCAHGQTGKHSCRQQCVLVCQGFNPQCLDISVTPSYPKINAYFATGNYDDALRDSKCARTFQPTFVNAILTGKVTIDIVIYLEMPHAQINRQ